MNELKYFSKRRVANILAIVVIIWTMALWTHILLEDIDGTPIDLGEVSGGFVLTVVGLMSGICGFALKHIFDTCGDDID